MTLNSLWMINFPQRVMVALLLLAVGCSETRTQGTTPTVLSCASNERIINGECVFVCRRDGDCKSGDRCNLLSGKCEPKPSPDAGPLPECTTGAVRCAQGTQAVETCQDDATWKTTEVCPTPRGICLNEKCLLCEPGGSWCDDTNNASVQICLDNGSAARSVTCAAGATCVSGQCRECEPGAQRCSVDGKNVQTCSLLGEESKAWGWKNSGDALDGSCITQVCQSLTASTAQCLPPTCFPGATQCKNASTQQVCSATGTWRDVGCSSLPGHGATAECTNGVCVDECFEAVKSKSYFGCEYWTAVQDNQVNKLFKGQVTSGQGTNDSDLAFVVTNRSLAPTEVTISRWFSGSEQTVKRVTVPGKNDAATRGLAVIKVPWQSLGSATDLSSVSGLESYGYRITSSRPVTVYQFSPLDAVKYGGSCSFFSPCVDAPGGVCQPRISGGPNVCHYYSYSNDASLLLPSHILGTSYVGMTVEQSKQKNSSGNSAFLNGHLTIVGTEDGTTVTIRSSAATKSGPQVPALSRGQTATFTLNRYSVLQLASDLPATHTEYECGPDPDKANSQLCRVSNDLSGTFVNSDKPVAVFGGSACAYVPYNVAACDHLEEQLFPFVTWGKRFVATRTAPLRMTAGSFANSNQAAPDYYKIVAGCSVQDCPQGTEIKITPTPTSSEIVEPTYCQTGTSLAANNCRLLGGDHVSFSSKRSIVITADQPISIGQFFAGQNATASTLLNAPTQGDPSFILLPPVEQWRSNYTLLAAPGIADNYLGIAIDASKVDRVEVDSVSLPLNNFTSISGTNFKVFNHPITVGTHVLTVIPKPGLSEVPGAGVTVYGFDSYVSYGYTGGLDLQSIVTVNPGG